MVIGAFIFSLCIFVVIGMLSVRQSKKNTQDYLMASQSIPPWLASLSAVATCCSGYMFVGQIGFTYSVGLSSIWLMIGWITGDFFSSLFIHKTLREKAEETGTLSFSELLGKWYNPDFRRLRAITALISILFLGIYAAAQLNAGSKALHVLFDWHYHTGAIIGAVIVLLYCLAGGIRASIWTDAAQSLVMIVSMGLLCGVALYTISQDHGPIVAQLHGVSAHYMDVFPTEKPLGEFLSPLLFVLGWLCGGLV